MRRIFAAAAAAILAAALGLAGLRLAPATPTQAQIDAAVTRSGPSFERARRLPVAARYPRDLLWQSNLSLCGPASLANLLRSLDEPAATEATVLAGTGLCRTGFCLLGLTLDELAAVARARTRRPVRVLRDLTPEAFREALRSANDPSRRIVVNFDRARIFGVGTGHHAPVGGYLEAEDLVLVLDVNRAYGPWLVERARLQAAVDTRDGERTRGLLVIE